jgi:hypothetical protein
VTRAADIYSTDVASWKCKTVDMHVAIHNALVVLKCLQKEQHAYADFFFWKSNTFLLFVLKPLDAMLVQWVPSSRTADELVKGFKMLLTKVKQREISLLIPWRVIHSVGMSRSLLTYIPNTLY